MEQIQQQVASARRRLALQQFLTIAPWALFTSLVIAAIGIAIPKIWVLNVAPVWWSLGWIGGGLAAAFLLSILWTILVCRTNLDAAVEIDRRFGLKERVSSALSLSNEERETEAGRALIADATRRVEVLVVKERFGVAATWRALLPLGPALVVFALVALTTDAAREQASAAADSAALREQIKKSTRELRDRLAKQQAEAKQKDLQEAAQLFKKLQQGLDDLDSTNQIDRKKALVKMNDLASEVAKRRDQLGDSNQAKNQFRRLNSISKGPADRMVNALQDGNFKKALEELKKISEKLNNAELTEEEKQKLADQLSQMQQKMQSMVDQQARAKQELQRQIQQKMTAGDVAAADKLQRQLDQLRQQDGQMERMQRLANSLGQCSECLQNGQAANASSQLARMASELESMQTEMDELATLNEIMDEIADAKDAMRNDGPMGDMFSQNSGMDGFGDSPGDGLGEGQGEGYRPEEESQTGEYKARERAQPKAGEAIRTGDAFGPNRAGLSMEELKAQMSSSLSNEADPLTDQRLPKAQREHVRQYNQRWRD